MIDGLSNSSETMTTDEPIAETASGETAPTTGRTVIEVDDLGVCFRLHRKKKHSFKQMILQRQKREPAPLLWALRNVDLTCYENEVLGIVGRNGAGKSTLCLALAGILTPDEGTVQTNGRVSSLLSLGAGVNKELSGRDNILLYSAFLGIPRPTIESKIDDIIDFSELGRFIDEPVRNYSSGMRARLAFSVATALDPEILILDEVLSVGDAGFKKKCKQRIEEMMQSSRLIIVVSHSLGFLKEICTHGLWLDEGSTKAHGDIESIVNDYKKSTKKKKTIRK